MSWQLRTIDPTPKAQVVAALQAATPEGDEPVSAAQLLAITDALPGLLAQVGADGDNVLVEVSGHAEPDGTGDLTPDETLHIVVRSAAGLNNGPRADEYAQLNGWAAKAVRDGEYATEADAHADMRRLVEASTD